MKAIKYIASLLAGITLFSCDNFEDINTNPDSVTRSEEHTSELQSLV